MQTKKLLQQLITDSLNQAREAGEVAFADLPAFEVETPKQAEHGDLASNAALVLASQAKRPPRQLAEMIKNNISAPPGVLKKITIAGPGFINFFLENDYWRQVLPEMLRLGETYGNCDFGASRRVQVEFVSANPTGPLHIGHGRGAALGDALARLLTAAGYRVEREYYINDAGTQILTLGKSLYYRLLELQGESVPFPEDGYQGDYLKDLARDYLAGGNPIPAPPPREEDFQRLGTHAAAEILQGIKQDLEDFGVTFDRWFSEATLHRDHLVEHGFAVLKDKGHLYEKDGALWFRATSFGDEKDRVLRRRNGATTYFAADVAYHLHKFDQGYDLMVDLWGADHHGYVPRMLAAAEALGFKERLKIILVQLVSLLRHGEPVAMTTRGGTFVTLREVLDEVGKDAARFIFLTRRADAHLDFDLEVAKQQNAENPVYYVQYAHARLASVFRQAKAQGIAFAPDPALLPLLSLPEELTLLKLLAGYPELVEGAARSLEPHRLTYFLTELASQLHSYYYKHRFISEDAALTQARLWLVWGIKTVLAHGLGILGVSGPESM
ncbi:MAG: arginine--tRNA ligase [Desulfobaccales bacterium]